ncbi:MAG: DUF2007 domain-containing protein [Vicinamibacterales bacterium]
MDKYCPECGEKYKDYESTCPQCQVPLLDVPADMAPVPDEALVAVMATTEAGLLPLARMALDEAGIEYAIKNRGFDTVMGRRSSMTVGETTAPLQVLVRSADEARAREILRDLQAPGPGLSAAADAPPQFAPVPAAPHATGGSVDLFDKQSGARIGQITRAQLDSLAQHLERESEDDDDYYIDEPTLTMLQEQGADAGVVELLRRALGSRPGMDVRWAMG